MALFCGKMTIDKFIIVMEDIYGGMEIIVGLFLDKINIFNRLYIFFNLKEPFFVRPGISCGLVIFEPFFWECKWEFQYV